MMYIIILAITILIVIIVNIRFYQIIKKVSKINSNHTAEEVTLLLLDKEQAPLPVINETLKKPDRSYYLFDDQEIYTSTNTLQATDFKSIIILIHELNHYLDHYKNEPLTKTYRTYYYLNYFIFINILLVLIATINKSSLGTIETILSVAIIGFITLSVIVYRLFIVNTVERRVNKKVLKDFNLINIEYPSILHKLINTMYLNDIITILAYAVIFSFLVIISFF